MLREKLYKKREESYTNSQRSLAHKLGDCKHIKSQNSLESGRSREHNMVGILHTTSKESCKQHLEESCTKHLNKVGGLLLTKIGGVLHTTLRKDLHTAHRGVLHTKWADCCTQSWRFFCYTNWLVHNILNTKYLSLEGFCLSGRSYRIIENGLVIREESLTEYSPPPMAGPTIIPTPVKSSR